MTAIAERPARRIRMDAAAKLAAFAFCRADLLVELNDDLRVEFASGARADGAMSGDELRSGGYFPDLVRNEDRDALVCALRSLDDSGRIIDYSVHLKIAGGNELECHMSGYRVPDYANNFFLALKFRPNRKAMPEPDSSRRDDQTGALEKDSFRDIATTRIRELQESGAEASFSLVRLDDLETIRQNLTDEGYGKLLGAVGKTLRKLSVDQDTVGRVSENAFGVVHDKAHGEDEIRERLNEASDGVLGQASVLATTIGVVDVSEKALSETEIANVLSFTIRRFIRSKESPKSGDLSTLLDEMAAENVEVVRMFKRICGTREFDFVYMPICDLDTGGVHHYEILSRFPRLDGISTFDMMSLAEEVGVISDFDLAAARKTVKLMTDMGKKLASTPGNLRRAADRQSLPSLALNISGQSIIDDAFIRELITLLRSVSNLARNLSFEITESAEIEDLQKANDNIQKLRTMGFHVALDDFGSGAASFDYLNALQVDVVKFDGPVVRRALSTPLGKDFLGSMASVCARSGIRTVAEMVEDGGMAASLVDFGIDFGQGYHFGKPSPDFPKG